MAVFDLSTFLLIAALVLACLALIFYWIGTLKHQRSPLALARLPHNPVLSPNPAHWWESEAVFNPAAFVHNGRVHLLYRALGRDGISRIGYASSPDGLHFDHHGDSPAYDPSAEALARARGARSSKLSYATLSYDTGSHGSGGGWGGSEDPRAVVMDDHIYMTFTSFEGWSNVRMTLTSLSLTDFEQLVFNWANPLYLSPPGEIQKNWLLFPEKINGKYAILHSITPTIKVDYVNSLNEFDGTKYITGSTRTGGRAGHWDSVVRGAGAPPIKTPAGWLLLYHGYDGAHAEVGYKVGAMLLDLNDPTQVVARSEEPILVPNEWYENDWKPGVVIASGAVVFNGDLIVYYGGGDKYVAAARINFDEFIKKLLSHKQARLTPATL
jgi:beta-1,2-mannobiose phosphorylase / 1,2-beta-oligomannan phosphorylase